MAFHVRDAETDLLARKLARRTGKGLTESVRMALEAELSRQDRDIEQRRAAVDAFMHEMDALPKTGLKADKTFFDAISGD